MRPTHIFSAFFEKGLALGLAVPGLSKVLRRSFFRPERRPFSVVALFLNEAGEVLSVSRKTDHEDLGLPGGKREPGETPEEAIYWEVLEETGVEIVKMERVFLRPCKDDKPAVCFLVTAWKGEPLSLEGAAVAWVKPSRLLEPSCSFRSYNDALFAKMGIASAG